MTLALALFPVDPISTFLRAHFETVAVFCVEFKSITSYWIVCNVFDSCLCWNESVVLVDFILARFVVEIERIVVAWSAVDISCLFEINSVVFNVVTGTTLVTWNSVSTLRLIDASYHFGTKVFDCFLCCLVHCFIISISKFQLERENDCLQCGFESFLKLLGNLNSGFGSAINNLSTNKIH